MSDSRTAMDGGTPPDPRAPPAAPTWAPLVAPDGEGVESTGMEWQALAASGEPADTPNSLPTSCQSRRGPDSTASVALAAKGPPW